jgi:hypothetical protein
MERGSESVDVGRRSDGRPLWVALLGSHVRVRSHRSGDLGGPLEAARDAEVDQPWWGSHDDVARLDVEVDELLGAEVMDRGADLQCQWE